MPNKNCCSEADFKLAAWDGSGPSTFYCANASRYRAHVLRTLPAQYRFMPALQHARATHMRADSRWLVLVDDDSWVAVPRLLRILGDHNHDRAVQLGDFIQPKQINDTHWHRPFACGGAGTVLSRTALQRIDWLACMRTFAGKCLQSDWMLGRCAYDHGVAAEQSMSCGVCGAASST